MDRLLEIEATSDDLVVLAENSKAIQWLVERDALVIPDCYLDFARIGAWKWVRFPAWGNLKYADSTDILDPMWGYVWIDGEIKKETEEAIKSGKTFDFKVWRLSTRYIQY